MPHFQARDGARLHYLDIGRGAPTVMLHAFGMRAAFWLPYVLPFALTNRFVMLDFRGFGGSRQARLTQADALGQNADDVQDLLAHLGLERPRMVGFSIGAASAFAYQRAYGFDHLRAYMHVDQTPCIANKPDWRWGLMGDDNAAALERGRTLVQAFEGVERDRPFNALPRHLQNQFWGWFAEFFRSCFGKIWWRLLLGAGGTRYGRSLLDPNNWGAYLSCVQSFIEQDYDFRDSLRRVRTPFWILVGRRSQVFPAEGQRRIADLVPGARVHEFRGVGHVIPVEAPMRFTYALGHFLART